MKVSPLETHNKYGVLTAEETSDARPRPIDPMIVSYYAINFISKLRRELSRSHPHALACGHPNSNTPRKIPKTVIRSAYIEHEVKLKVGLKTVDTHAIADVNALLDCGATDLFINRAFVRKKEIRMRKLQDPITVYNIDGTVNRGGSITEEVTLIMSHQGHKERAVFEVCDLGKTDLIIGFTWLKKHNPEINWRTGEVEMTRCPRECNVFARQLKKVKKVKREKSSTRKYSVTMEEVPDEDMPNGDSPITIKEGDEWKAAFATRQGSFEPLVMFFGMTNSPPTFQNMMNDILKEEIDCGVVIVFIDDILIFTEKEEGHEEIVKEVLRKLKENDLFLKAEKCIFGASEIEFLGLIIGPDGIKTDPIKVNAIGDVGNYQSIGSVEALFGGSDT